MHKLKPFIAYLLVLFILTGNIGFRVFEHSCKEEGVFHSVIIPVTNAHCEMHEKEMEAEKLLPPCCQKPEKLQKDTCCHDESAIVQVQFGFFSNDQLHAPAFQVLLPEPLRKFLIPSFIVNGLPEENTLIAAVDPPPLFYGRTILVHNQVFRL